MSAKRGLNRVFMVLACAWYVIGGFWGYVQWSHAEDSRNLALSKCIAGDIFEQINPSKGNKADCEKMWELTNGGWVTWAVLALFVLLLPALVYGLVYLAVRVTAWIIKGFRSEKQRNQGRGLELGRPIRYSPT